MDKKKVCREEIAILKRREKESKYKPYKNEYRRLRVQWEKRLKKLNKK